MVLVRKRIPRRKVRFTKKSTVKKIVKSTINRQIETKTLQFGCNDTTINYVTQYYTDPAQYIVAGSSQGQRIGNKLTNVYMRLALTYTHTDLALFQGSCLRVLVIKTDQKYPNVGGGAWNTSAGLTAFEWLFSAQTDMSAAITNKYDYTILKDMTIKSHRNYSTISGVPNHRVLNLKLGNLNYEADQVSGVAYQKFRNTYILVGVSNIGTSSANAAGILSANGFLYFKDA